MNNILVFTATYNEVDNIRFAARRHLRGAPRLRLSWSSTTTRPTRPGELLEQIRAGEPRLQVIHRPGKNGLGTAHKLAVKYALAEGYDALITMDADFSHDPSYLPEMVRQLEQAEFVIGSRYVAGRELRIPAVAHHPEPRRQLAHARASSAFPSTRRPPRTAVSAGLCSSG